MLYSSESFLHLHQQSEAEFIRDLEFRRVARERIDESRGVARSVPTARRFRRA